MDISINGVSVTLTKQQEEKLKKDLEQMVTKKQLPFNQYGNMAVFTKDGVNIGDNTGYPLIIASRVEICTKNGNKFYGYDFSPAGVREFIGFIKSQAQTQWPCENFSNC